MMRYIEVILFICSGVTTGVCGWAVWATVAIFNLKEQVALNTQDDINVKELTANINSKLDMIVSDLNSIKIALAKNDIEVK